MSKKDIENMREVLGSLIIMLTINSGGKTIRVSDCETMLKLLMGKKWEKKYEDAVKNL